MGDRGRDTSGVVGEATRPELVAQWVARSNADEHSHSWIEPYDGCVAEIAELDRIVAPAFAV